MFTKLSKTLKLTSAFAICVAVLAGSAFATETTDNTTTISSEKQAHIDAFAKIFSPITSAIEAKEAEEIKKAEEARLAEESKKAEQLQAMLEQEATRLAAIEKENAAKQAAAISVYTPNYRSSVTYSNNITPTATLKANAISKGEHRITFYCACSKCCGKSDGITSSGTKVKEGRTIAVDPKKIPIGSKVFIEGLGDFIAEDVGGAIKSNKIDVYLDSHSKCYQLGVKYSDVYVLN